MTNYEKYLTLFKECLAKKYFHTFEGGSYYYEIKGDTLYIFFEWSHGFVDWLNNFYFPKQAYKDTKMAWKVHRGFLRVWKSIECEIENVVKFATINKIQIVGYSHGAALAMLCHEYCIFNRPDCIVEGYGFGCPRVLYGKYSDELLKRWENFTVIRNYDDLVTHMPPKLFGFRHVGKMVDLTPKWFYIKSEKKFIEKFIAGHYDTSIIEQLENNRDEVNEDVRQIEKMIKRIEKMRKEKDGEKQ